MRFSTSDLPASLSDEERAAAWVSALSAVGGGYRITTPRTAKFFGAFELRAWGELRLGVAIASSFELERTQAHIEADGADGVGLVMNRGRLVHSASQYGRNVEIHPGGLALFDLGAPIMGRATDGGHLIRVMLPRAPFSELDLTRVAARSLDGKSEVGRLVRNLVGDLLRRDLSPPGLAEATIAYLAALLCVLARNDPRVTTHPQAINHTRLKRAKEMIAERYGDSAFCITTAAAELGVSPRHLQTLFAAEGETFSDCLAACRLDSAYIALSSAAGPHDAISEIADRCGFADVSTFYRRFRARYGRSPALVRADHDLAQTRNPAPVSTA